MSGNWAWHPERMPEASNGRYLCQGVYGCTKTVKENGKTCLTCRRKLGLTKPKKEKTDD